MSCGYAYGWPGSCCCLATYAILLIRNQLSTLVHVLVQETAAKALFIYANDGIPIGLDPIG